MTIRRPYSLPNCTLILEGLSDGTSGQVDARPLMSILVNAECRFAGQEKPLTGGRDFFESLVMAVSNYAQEFLSGVPHWHNLQDKPTTVQLHRVNDHLHRLSVEMPGSAGDSNTAGVSTANSARQVDLTTVQLFDLVDAVDQFLADSRTLPDINLSIAPVPKRYAKAEVPVAQRAAPAAVGVSILGVAAIAFFVIPPPNVEPPKDASAQPNASATTPASPVASQEPTISPTPVSADATNLESLLTSVPEITDPTQLRALERRLYDKIAQTWSGKRRRFSEQLIYRVGVGQDGAIVGYKPVNVAARDRASDTPLPELLYIPAGGSTFRSSDPIGQFKVVFTRTGVLQVSPWRGYTGEPSLGPQITDPTQLESLKTQLESQINGNWKKESVAFPRNLVYRVAVNKDGAIADYEPYNQPGYDYVKQTPLPNLVNPNQSATTLPQEEPLAQFQVVFKPNGVVEVEQFRD